MKLCVYYTYYFIVCSTLCTHSEHTSKLEVTIVEHLSLILMEYVRSREVKRGQFACDLSLD